MSETQKQVDPPAQQCFACGTQVQRTSTYCPSCGVSLSGTTGRLQTDRVLAGRYRIVRLIARGGMGAVYLAEDLRLAEAQVAVKEMASSFARGDTEAFKQAVVEFEREAAMLARLRHPHLPRVSDRFAEEGKHYLVMEYIHGQTLRAVVQQQGGRLALGQVLNYADQLADVLTYLHSQQPPIIYRDLKPANVMVVPAGEPGAPPSLVLIDFGIARFYRPDRSTDTAVYGTAGYAPPEQYGRGQTDARTDIYAFGVLLHHLLTGHDPAATPFALPAPRTLDPSIPPAVAAAIERATAIERSARFDNIAAFRMALHAGTPISQEPTVRRQPDRAAPRQRPPEPAVAPRARRGFPGWAFAAVGVALLIVVVVLALASFGRGQTAGAPTAEPAIVASPLSELTAAPTLAPAEPTPSPVSAIDLGSDGATPRATGPGPQPVLLRPSGVSASEQAEPAFDSQGNSVTYEPALAVDGDPGTAWRVAGDGKEHWIQLDFPVEVSIYAIGLIPGYAKIDPADGTDRFMQNRVVKLVRFEFSSGEPVRASFTRQRDMQFVALGGLRTRSIRIVIEETFPAPAEEQGGRDFTPISEVQVQGLP